MLNPPIGLLAHPQKKEKSYHVIEFPIITRAYRELAHPSARRVDGHKHVGRHGRCHNRRHFEHLINKLLGKTGHVLVLDYTTKFFDRRRRIRRVEELEALALFGTEPVGRLLDMVAQNLLVPIQLAAVLADHLAVTDAEKGLAINLQIDELGKVVVGALGRAEREQGCVAHLKDW